MLVRRRGEGARERLLALLMLLLLWRLVLLLLLLLHVMLGRRMILCLDRRHVAHVLLVLVAVRARHDGQMWQTARSGM